MHFLPISQVPQYELWQYTYIPRDHCSSLLVDICSLSSCCHRQWSTLISSYCKQPVKFRIIFDVIVEWYAAVQVGVVWCEVYGVVYDFTETNFVTEMKYLMKKQTDTHIYTHIFKHAQKHTQIMSDSSRLTSPTFLNFTIAVLSIRRESTDTKSAVAAAAVSPSFTSSPSLWEPAPPKAVAMSLKGVSVDIPDTYT